MISSYPQHESLVLFLSSKIHYRTILPNTLREPAPNTLKERTMPISRPEIRKIEHKNQKKTSKRRTSIAVFFLSKTKKLTLSSSSSSSTSPSSSSFVTAQSLRNIQIVLLPGSSEGDFFQALSLSSILAAGLHERRTWPISLDREPTKPRNST